jgi:benzoyl-CoA 2,3-dioxygenase component B
MGPMLKEEGFHLGTGHMGLQRIAKAGRLPVPLFQKFINKWLSTAYDLFGKDHSSSAEWFYVWGLKGRYDEHHHEGDPDREHLNELSREMYKKEVDQLLEQVNRQLPANGPKLVSPDLKFHRGIGKYAGQTYSVTGDLLTPEEHEKHLQETLPTPEEQQKVAKLMREPGWIAPRESLTSAT